MDRLTRYWFSFSDVVAWALLVFAVVGAIAFPLVGPIHARMAGQPLTVLGIVGTCALWLFVAAGAYAVIRRRALGLIPLLAPSIALAASGQTAPALACSAAWAAVFAAPFLLVLVRARSVAASRPAA